MGAFITFEGGDGCGKTSVMKAIIDKLKEENFDIVLTREPGGGKISEQIRNVILDVNNKEMHDITEMLLYAASRNQHLHDVILPNLKAGKIVISDRFVDSSYVYQGITRNLGLELVTKINDFVIKDTMPDLTIYIDATPEICLGRRKGREEEENRLDLESLQFHHKVREGYKMICEKNKERMVIIDGDQPLQKVIDDTYKIIKNFLSRKQKWKTI